MQHWQRSVVPMSRSVARDIVLVVDDSPDTLRMLTDAIEDAGMTVLVAREGAQALAMIARVTPDVILMDAVMPGLEGQLRWCTPQAAALLGASIRDFSAKDYVLPPEIQRWLGDRAGGASSVPDTIELKSDQGRVRLRLSFVGQIGPDEILLRLMEGEVGTEAELLRRKLMLTQREAEVVLWIARGKANRDIAEILSLSPRTVNKHLEQIFSKLGVENRTAAAAIAVRALSP